MDKKDILVIVLSMIVVVGGAAYFGAGSLGDSAIAGQATATSEAGGGSGSGAVSAVYQQLSAEIDAVEDKIVCVEGDGKYSVLCSGKDNIASGQASNAFGWESEASGLYATAMGYQSIASGDWGSLAVGKGAEASGSHSAAIGLSSEAKGDSSLALGSYAVVEDHRSVTINARTTTCVSSTQSEFRVCADDIVYEINGNEVPMSEVVDLLCEDHPDASFC